MYCFWDMKPDRHFFVILDYFLPFFLPLTTRKIKILKKWKNYLTYYHFAYVHHKWKSYDVWFLRLERNRQNSFSFWTIFCPFTPLTTQKIKIFKNEINAWRYDHFTHVYHKWQSYDIYFVRYEARQTKCTKNHDHMLYCSWDMARDECNCYFSLWAIFLPFHPANSPKNQTLKKWKKTPWKHHHFTHVYQKLWSDDVRFLRYGTRRTYGRTDGRKKWHIEVGAPVKNIGASLICESKKTLWKVVGV